jgi:radical SAM superfamily enzyme YgiQ (UPF0313 family)
MFGEKKNKEIVENSINGFKPQIIAFYAVSTEYYFITRIAKYIKNYFPEIYLIIGGPFVTMNPEGVLENYDSLCIGEGEMPMVELASQLETNLNPSNILNLWIRHGLEIERNLTRPFLQNLDILPFPDREMWKDWIEDPNSERLTLLLGRGCPFECTYCSNYALKKVASGLYARYRSPENIIGEIKELIKQNPNMKEIYFEIETIAANYEWVIEFCHELQLFNKTINQRLSYGANIRITPNMHLREIFHNLKQSNFKHINIGVESGSEKLRSEVLNRNYSNEDIVNATNLIKENGLQVYFYSLIGLPGETLNDFKETIKLHRKCLPDAVDNAIFYPYPGTKLYSLCKEQGFMKQSISTDIERVKSILNMPDFNSKEIERGHIWFEYMVYKDHKPKYKLLLITFYNMIVSNHDLFWLYIKVKNIFFIRKIHIFIQKNL